MSSNGVLKEMRWRLPCGLIRDLDVVARKLHLSREDLVQRMIRVMLDDCFDEFDADRLARQRAPRTPAAAGGDLEG